MSEELNIGLLEELVEREVKEHGEKTEYTKETKITYDYIMKYTTQLLVFFRKRIDEELSRRKNLNWRRVR